MANTYVSFDGFTHSVETGCACPACCIESANDTSQDGQSDSESRFDGNMTAALRLIDLGLLDTIGELRMAYALADVVIIGRSFGDLHGSDMMEPVALGKPTIVGPATGDFQSTVDALIDGDGLVRTTRGELPAVGIGETAIRIREEDLEAFVVARVRSFGPVKAEDVDHAG